MRQSILILVILSMLFVFVACSQAENKEPDAIIDSVVGLGVDEEEITEELEVVEDELEKLEGLEAVEETARVEEELIVVSEEIEIVAEYTIDEGLEDEGWYEYITRGYFFSEPFDDIYPTVVEDGIEIIGGETGVEYILISVEDELDNHFIIPEDGNYLRYEIRDGKIELEQEEMDKLYTNMVFYLYKVL